MNDADKKELSDNITASVQRAYDAGMEFETGKAGRLVEMMEWVAQTIHQAHHNEVTDTGSWTRCKKNTCAGIMKALNEYRRDR